MMEWDERLSFSISATTRAARSGETEGKEYFFRSNEAFETMVNNNEMLEHAYVFGHYYGSPRKPVEEVINSGRDVIFDIDWQGGQQIKNSGLADNSVSIFILPPSLNELRDRLFSRGQDAEKIINDRMRKCQDEISHWAEYDYCLVNNDLESTIRNLKSIFIAERLKRNRQLYLLDVVKDLSKEAESFL